jgi:hypothetical protein
VAYVAIIGVAVALAAFVVLAVMVVSDRREARNYWDEVSRSARHPSAGADQRCLAS